MSVCDPVHNLRAQSDLLTRDQAAAFLGVKPQTLAVWLSTKRYDLPVVKIGRSIVRYRRSDLEAFLARQTIGAAE
jgi:predicted DNA-binding transcriptional regulator AlpA